MYAEGMAKGAFYTFLKFPRAIASMTYIYRLHGYRAVEQPIEVKQAR